MREIEKRIENLENRYPGEEIILEVYSGEQLSYRVFINDNNRHEYWNPKTGTWQDEPVKELA